MTPWAPQSSTSLGDLPGRAETPLLLQFGILLWSDLKMVLSRAEVPV